MSQFPQLSTYFQNINTTYTKISKTICILYRARLIIPRKQLNQLYIYTWLFKLCIFGLGFYPQNQFVYSLSFSQSLLNCASSCLRESSFNDTRLCALPIINTLLRDCSHLPSSIGSLRAFVLSCVVR